MIARRPGASVGALPRLPKTDINKLEDKYIKIIIWLADGLAGLAGYMILQKATVLYSCEMG